MNMSKKIALKPYDSWDISTFAVQGDTVHISHFGGSFDNSGKKIFTIEEQTMQAFKNLEKALKQIDLGLHNLLKVTVILKNIKDFNKMHEVWKQIFQVNYPTRTTITSDFVDDHCLIQIDGVAESN